MSVSDCVIFGGGPAGCAAAIRLTQLNAQRVIVIDRSPPDDRYQIGESAAPSVTALLNRLGLNADLAAQGHLPCHGNRSLWGSDTLTEQDFIFKGLGHGWHLDRAAFDAELRRQAEALGVRFIYDAQLRQLGRFEDSPGWGLILSTERYPEQKIRSHALIDATGNRALVAHKLGSKRIRLDTLTAVATVIPQPESSDLQNMSLIEAHSDGWWYGAEIPQRRMVIACMTDADLLKKHQLSEPGKLRQLACRSQLFQPYLQSITADQPLYVYPAGSAWLDTVAGPGWLAIGNAALSQDPLTASGINCALHDGIVGADAIIKYLGGDLTGLTTFAVDLNKSVQRYLTDRQRYYQLEQRWASEPFWQRRQA